jgi:hypothetical protein
MYLRIVPFRYDPAREAEVLRLTEEQALPAFRRLPGFRHYFGAGDRAAGRGYTITIWDTAEQAEGLRSALGALVAQFQALGVQFEAPEVHEVLAHA